jgi:hypothetical protein
VVAATLDARESVVYFELSSSLSLTSGSSVAVVYDLSLRSWVSLDSRTSYAGSAGQRVTDSAVIWDGSTYRYAWLGADGRVRPEQDSYVDTGSGDTWITLKATTAWIKLSGIQGQQAMNRVLLLAKKSTRADVNIALAYDYDDSFETATPWVANDIDTLSTALGRVQLGHDTHVEGEGQSIRVSVYDATPTGGTVSTGQGATFVALTFEGTPRPNAAQLPEDAR